MRRFSIRLPGGGIIDLDAWIENPVSTIRTDNGLAAGRPIFLDGVRLDDKRTLSSYGVDDGSTLQLGDVESNDRKSGDSNDSSYDYPKVDPRPPTPARPSEKTTSSLRSPNKLTKAKPGFWSRRRSRDYEKGLHKSGYSLNRTRRIEVSAAEQQDAQELAADILGSAINSPTVRIILELQATRMHVLEWGAVKEVVEGDRRARVDLARLGRLLENRRLE